MERNKLNLNHLYSHDGWPLKQGDWLHLFFFWWGGAFINPRKRREARLMWNDLFWSFIGMFQPFIHIQRYKLLKLNLVSPRLYIYTQYIKDREDVMSMIERHWEAQTGARKSDKRRPASSDSRVKLENKLRQGQIVNPLFFRQAQGDTGVTRVTQGETTPTKLEKENKTCLKFWRRANTN